jgi:chromosome segregation ATPase
MSTNEETKSLKKRVAELEKQLENLRVSRRVLMDLLEQVEKEKDTLIHKLEKKTHRIQGYGRNNKQTQGIVLNIKDYLKK